MQRRLAVFSLLVLTLAAPAARANLDPELKTPYDIRVVLSVGEHRMLTSLFQERLETDLRDRLQLALGGLARVEVVQAHPLLADVKARGLQAGLDGHDKLSPQQTLFVLVDYSAGQYRLQTRVFDGLTGTPSPVVRKMAVGDRQRVADAAVDALLGDFAVVGTFQQIQGHEVKVALRGGDLGGGLGSLVQPGDAFAIVRVTRDANGLRASVIDWALLQALESPKDGHVRCRYSCRYDDDRTLTDAPPVVGYRCVKLPTARGPVKVRLVDEKTQEFLNLRVVVCSDADYKQQVAAGATDPKIRGYFESGTAVNKVAYVRVLSGATPLVEFPLALVDDRVVVCRMSENQAALRQGEIELRRQRWVRWHLEALGAADQRLAEFNAMLGPKTLEEALKLGQQGHEALTAEIERLRGERIRIVQLAASHKTAAPDLSDGDQLSTALSRRAEQLAKYLVDLDKMVKEATGDERKALVAQLKKAEVLEKQADFDKALEIYDTVVKAWPSPDVEAHAKLLRTAWAIKSKEHAQARQFIYEVWPTLDLAGVKANAARAREMFQRCQAAGDVKTPQKLVLANVQHATVLVKRLEVLRKAPDTDDNRTETKALVQLAQDLRALQSEALTWTGIEKKTK